MMLLRSLCLVAFASSFGINDAFVPRMLTTSSRPGSVARMSEPSDTSSDSFSEDDPAVMTVESEDFTPNPAESLVTNVLDLIPSTIGEVSESKRAIINEILLKLEALNPTKEPTRSPLLNGVWELRYAAGYTAEGALPSPTR
jgi:hypothetical protein